MMLDGFSKTSICLDAMAFLLVFGLLILPDRKQIRDKNGAGLFLGLCVNAILIAVFDAVCRVLVTRGFSWSRTAELILRTLLEIAYLHLAYQWIMYADYKLYESPDQLRRRYRGLYIPVLLFVLFLFINLFTGILFSVSPEGLHKTWLYGLMVFLEFLYMLLPVVLIFQYDREHSKNRLFDVAPTCVPMVGGRVISLLTGYPADVIGAAVGLLLLYFSLMNSRRFEDEMSGYYNRAFLNGILKSDSRETDRLHGLVLFETKDDEEELGRILRGEMPKDGIMIHIRKGTYALLCPGGMKGDLEFLADLVEEAAKEEGFKGSLRTECMSREKDEDAKAFLLRTVLSDEAGENT